MADIARKMHVLLRPNLGARLWKWGRMLGHFIFYFLSRKNLKDHMEEQAAKPPSGRWYWPPEPMPPIAAPRKRQAWPTWALVGLLAGWLLAIFVGLPLLLTGKLS